MNASHHGSIHRFAKYAGGRLELWVTPCVVSMPPPGSNALLVPSNERLCGTQFSHFPVGGPTPSAPVVGVQSNLGSENASRVSPNILYPCESVDGTVTEVGGPMQLKAVTDCAPILNGDEEYPIRCPTGEARRVSAVHYLAQNYDHLILSVAPFWPGSPTSAWQTELQAAYRNAFFLSAGTLVTPLLGAGARGAPIEEVAVAVTDLLQGLYLVKEKDSPSELGMIRFSVLEEDVAELLDEHFSEGGL